MMKEYSSHYSMEKAMEFAKSPAGQQLISLLKSSDSAALRKAMALVSQGDLEGAKTQLGDIANTPQIQQLLSQMRKP